MAAAAACAALAAREVDAALPTLALALAVIAVAAGVGRSFLARPTARRGQVFFALSGVWLVVMYLALGIAAWLRFRAGA
jgi:hypothetical protein